MAWNRRLAILANFLSLNSVVYGTYEPPWSQLRAELGSNLLVNPDPPFAVCHPSQPTYNQGRCDQISSQATNSSFIADSPVAIDYNDIGCVANSSAPCDLSFYPRYVVNASRPSHVASALKFASEHGVKINVKATGHDYNGRSLHAQRLSIWTHQLRGFDVHESFRPAECEGCFPYSAATIGTGLQVAEIQRLAFQNNITVVTGSDPTVGVAGHFLGGGHSPVSSVYGLAADQVLEIELVTPDGVIRTVNEVSHPDLFFALRGAGPSTFGVVTKVTVRTHPLNSCASIVMNMTAEPKSDTFWQSVALFHSHLPSISDAGLMGYYTITGNSSSSGSANVGLIEARLTAINATKEQALKALQTLNDYASVSSGQIQTSTNITLFHSWYHWWSTTTQPLTVGTTSRLGSRLLTRKALATDQQKLARNLRIASGDNLPLLGNLVAGKGVENAVKHIAGGSNAVLPAWRKTVTHLILPALWTALDQPQQENVTRTLTYTRVKALADLDPEAGSYMSEGDPCEPDWQNTFYGSNYARLLSIKQKWDPKGLFDCFPCVGGDQSQVKCPSP